MEDPFIADVHLGKLARMLRLLGFDTIYKNDFTINELIKISEEQNRILLSKNNALTKNNSIQSFIVTHEDPFNQLKQVVDHFKLKDQVHPFSRCMVCNGTLETVSKKDIASLLENNTALYFDEFWQCRNCKRIYWKGSHYERMQKTIEGIIFKQ